MASVPPDAAAAVAASSSSSSADRFWTRTTSPLAATTTTTTTGTIPFQSPAAFRGGPLRILRVSQLDADLLDSELSAMIKDQLLDAVSLFKINLKQSYDPEITAVLQWLMNYFSLYAMGATYGLDLQNLRYRDESRHSGDMELSALDAPLRLWQKVTHAVLHIGGRWGLIRLKKLASQNGWSERPSDDWRNRIWRLVHRAEQVYQALSFANFMVFLFDGRYRSLLDRILRMRLVYKRRELSRQISYEYMNRQLVWNAFTEFLMFLIPVINLPRLRRSLQRVFSVGRSSDLANLPANVCAICVSENREPAVVKIPYATNCGHVYCYYCIRSNVLADSSYACLRCGETVHSMRDNRLMKESL
ncbi:Pex12 amino terminal region-domain-containing protein [Zopfochytrium polystomum]|nr:Pex12 amino terminal region-domain-containing protein [Zopfochytrium polystomum]